MLSESCKFKEEEKDESKPSLKFWWQTTELNQLLILYPFSFLMYWLIAGKYVNIWNFNGCLNESILYLSGSYGWNTT